MKIKEEVLGKDKNLFESAGMLSIKRQCNPEVDDCKKKTLQPDNDNLLKTLDAFLMLFQKNSLFLTKSFKTELFKTCIE